MESGVDTSLFGDGKDLDLDSVQDNLDFFVKTMERERYFLVVRLVNIMVK